MPKKTRHGTPSPAESVADHSKLEVFAEDLGHLLGQAQNEAETWLAQRKAIADHLVRVRETANRLLAQLGVSDTPARRRGRPARAAGAEQAAAGRAKPKRVMSAEARARIAAAQRARWAKLKKAAK